MAAGRRAWRLTVPLWGLAPLCAAAAPPPVEAPTAKVSIEERIVRYRIFGRSALELAEQMRQHGPQHALGGRRLAGSTDWHVTWSYQSLPRHGRCELLSVTVGAEIVITLPEWSGARVESELAREWRRFYAGLEQHEAGHVRHGREAALAVRDAMLAATAQPDCKLLRRALDNAARAQLRRYASLTRRYDAETDFGLEQGVQLRP
jgi:predicted secreted Zn-dependent protease